MECVYLPAGEALHLSLPMAAPRSLGCSGPLQAQPQPQRVTPLPAQHPAHAPLWLSGARRPAQLTGFRLFISFYEIAL